MGVCSQERSQYERLVVGLHERLREWTLEGRSGELRILYAPTFHLVIASFIEEVHSRSVQEVAEKITAEVMAFSESTEHNPNGNESGYEMNVRNHGTKVTVRVWYRYKLPMTD